MSTLSEFDAAVAAELPRVSTVEYNSHEICKHFAEKVRERLQSQYRIVPGKGGNGFAFVFGDSYPHEADENGNRFETFSAADAAAIKHLREMRERNKAKP